MYNICNRRDDGGLGKYNSSRVSPESSSDVKISNFCCILPHDSAHECQVVTKVTVEPFQKQSSYLERGQVNENDYPGDMENARSFGFKPTLGR